MNLAAFLALDKTLQRRKLAELRRHARASGVLGKFLSFNVDPKTAKSNKSGKGYLTVIQYFAPSKLSGRDVCVFASPGCRRACLHTAGNPIYQKGKHKARIAKTRYYLNHFDNYTILLYAELVAFVEKCDKFDLKPAVRLNGTSDIVWEFVFPELFELFPNVQFYDYTKDPTRTVVPSNYDLTFSLSETNLADAVGQLRVGRRVAVVFDTKRTKPLPSHWQGYSVGDADKDDLRFLDKASISGLRAKGKARNDCSGFVQKEQLYQLEVAA